MGKALSGTDGAAEFVIAKVQGLHLGFQGCKQDMT